MPGRQEGIPAQPVRVVTGRAAEKAVQSPACNLVLEQAWLRSSPAAPSSVSEKRDLFEPSLGSKVVKLVVKLP